MSLSIGIKEITAPMARKLAKEAATEPFAAHSQALFDSTNFVDNAARDLAQSHYGEEDEVAEAGRQIFFARRAISDTPSHAPFDEWAANKRVNFDVPMQMPFDAGTDDVARAHAALSPVADAWKRWLALPGGERGGFAWELSSSTDSYSQALKDARAVLKQAISDARSGLSDAKRAVKDDQTTAQSRFEDLLIGKALITKR